MTKETDFMIQSLFQRESMDEMTLDELQRHSEEFPYSSIIQFLYTCKLKSQYHLDFPEAVSKTALFFDDSSWLNYQLSEDKEKGKFRKILYDAHYNNTSEDDLVEGTEDVLGVDEVDEVAGMGRIEDSPEIEEVSTVEKVEQVEEAGDVGDFEEFPGIEETENFTASEDAIEVEVAEEVEGLGIVEAVEVVEVTEKVDAVEEIISNELVEEAEEVKADFVENEGISLEPSAAESNERIDLQETETKTTPETNKDFEFPLTPYHTIDYFASLGIKVNSETEKDELSMKVKSFTAWLKTMKRLQPGTETVTIKDIQSILAPNSENESAPLTVLTEAMAEVYLKQGLREKAIEVYQKLSLQNPLNSHIFADKISQIKENRI